jgi:hypothetical protein
MRIREIILEDFETMDEVIQDASERPEYAVLISTLENLRSQAGEKDTPRIEANKLIDIVKNIPGGEGFNQALLDSAYKDNETVKGLIKSVKVDPHNGVNYVNLAPNEQYLDTQDPLGADSAPAGDPSKIVSKMANRAASK